MFLLVGLLAFVDNLTLPVRFCLVAAAVLWVPSNIRYGYVDLMKNPVYVSF